MRLRQIKLQFLKSRALALIQHPMFGFLTVIGNSVILFGAILLYKLEQGINPNLHSFLDALWWGVATVTTVGNGPVIPITTPGKILGMLMMIGGTAVFGSFTALFATILLTPEIEWVEREVEEVEREIEEIQK